MAAGATSAERDFFRDDRVTVTRTRAIMGPSTYAMANITSVRADVEVKPVWVIVFGLFLVLAGGGFLWLGAYQMGAGMAGIGAVLALVYLFVLKHKYWVKIGTAGAEVSAIWSYDVAWTSRVVAAMNEAIVARG